MKVSLINTVNSRLARAAEYDPVPPKKWGLGGKKKRSVCGEREGGCNCSLKCKLRIVITRLKQLNGL